MRETQEILREYEQSGEFMFLGDNMTLRYNEGSWIFDNNVTETEVSEARALQLIDRYW